LSARHAVPSLSHVLAVLDRVHSPGPGRSTRRAKPAAPASITSISTSYMARRGSSDDDPAPFRSTHAIGAGVDHVSGYALVVEDGTAVGRAGCGAGEISAPGRRRASRQRYELLDAHLSAAGFDWYEVSNWCRPGGECRHNLGVLGRRRNGGVPGRGAHGFRRCHPLVECQAPQRLCAIIGRRGCCRWPDFERLDATTQHVRGTLMLRLRLREGLPVAVLNDGERARR